MKVLVTGAKGFLGRNLCAQLNNIRLNLARNYPVEIEEVMEYDLNYTGLEEMCRKADFVFNLAGVNRPENPDDFMKGNFGFASTLLDTLKRVGNHCPVMLSSSIQAELDNPYGASKRAGEELFKAYSEETGAKTFIYRFPNLFGKWCRPNYNSVVATFCHNVAHDLPIKVNDPKTELSLAYVDDVVSSLIAALTASENFKPEVSPVHKVTLGQIAELLRDFSQMHENLEVPELQEDSFEKKLYSTYLSYLPKDKVAYDLETKSDNRGSFTEFLHLGNKGQISVNISKPGITKGEHWHHSKNEKFLVVSGRGLIKMRKIGEDEIWEFPVSGEKLQVVEMLPGYTHNLINLSETEDMVTLIWCNETFDPENPDTYHQLVN